MVYKLNVRCRQWRNSWIVFGDGVGEEKYDADGI